VSIGVPFYNAEKTISLCLEYIIGSDYDLNRIEIILVDNFSHDKGAEVAKKTLSYHNIKYRILNHKGSLDFLRSIILNNARGKYII